MVQTKDFADFDEFVDSVKGVEAKMTMQGLDRRQWGVEQLGLPGCALQRGTVGSGNIVEGQMAPEGHILYLPLTDGCRYAANGVTISKGSFLVLEPGAEFTLSTQNGHDWLSLHLSIDLEAGQKGHCRISPTNHHLAVRIHSLINHAMIAGRYSGFANSSAANSLAQQIQSVSAGIIAGPKEMPQKRRRGRRTVRKQVIDQCQQLIEENWGNPPQMEQLTAATDTSERTIRRAFQDYYGVGLRTYLFRKQMQRVRRMLKVADPREMSVTQILFANGIWELGRFASRYRETFGELPSETLRR